MYISGLSKEVAGFSHDSTHLVVMQNHSGTPTRPLQINVSFMDKAPEALGFIYLQTGKFPKLGSWLTARLLGLLDSHICKLANFRSCTLRYIYWVSWQFPEVVILR